MLFARVKLLTRFMSIFSEIQETTQGFHVYQDVFIWYKLIRRLFQYPLLSSENTVVRKIFRLCLTQSFLVI